MSKAPCIYILLKSYKKPTRKMVTMIHLPNVDGAGVGDLEGFVVFSKPEDQEEQ